MRRISILAGLSMLAALSLSQSAVAHSTATPATVNAHVQQAVAALQDFQAAVKRGDNAAARGALKRNRKQTAAAVREAGQVDGTTGAQVVSKVGRLQARNASAYASSFPLAAPDLQLDLTELIGVAVDACATAADTIESIAGLVPEVARQHVLDAAERVRAACADAIPEVPGSGGGSGSPTDVSGLLGQCHSAIQQWTGFVSNILGKVTAMLPIQIPVLGNMLESMLGMADSACDLLGGIGPVSDHSGSGLLGGLLDGILGGSNGGGLLGSLLGGFGFGNLFGGIGAGSAAAH